MGFLIVLLIVAAVVLVGGGSLVFILFLFGVGKAREGLGKTLEKKEKAFDQEYITAPISTGKLQRKLTLTFYGRWVKLIVGGVMLAAIAMPLVRLMQEGSMSGDEFFPILLKYGAIAVVGFIVLMSPFCTKNQIEKLAGVVARPILEEFFGSDLSYEPRGRIPDELIHAARFVPGYTSVEGSDLVRGHYRGVPVVFSDIKFTKTKKEYDPVTKKNTTSVETLFKGAWIAAEFDRELTPVPLNVVEERNRDAIQTESVVFNQTFSIYCADEHTAFYILTPHFMERLLEVNHKANGRCYFQFDKNRLQIAVHTGKDQLDAKRFSPPSIKRMQERFRREIGQMTSVIDEMLQHERLFGKVDTPAH